MDRRGGRLGHPPARLRGRRVGRAVGRRAVPGPRDVGRGSSRSRSGGGSPPSGRSRSPPTARPVPWTAPCRSRKWRSRGSTSSWRRSIPRRPTWWPAGPALRRDAAAGARQIHGHRRLAARGHHRQPRSLDVESTPPASTSSPSASSSRRCSPSRRWPPAPPRSSACCTSTRATPAATTCPTTAPSGPRPACGSAAARAPACATCSRPDWSVRSPCAARCVGRDSHNVVGELPGADDEAVMIAPHHDAPWASAVEDGTGIALVLAQVAPGGAAARAPAPPAGVRAAGRPHGRGRRPAPLHRRSPRGAGRGARGAPRARRPRVRRAHRPGRAPARTHRPGHPRYWWFTSRNPDLEAAVLDASPSSSSTA